MSDNARTRDGRDEIEIYHDSERDVTMNDDTKEMLNEMAEQIEANPGSPKCSNQVESVLDGVVDAQDYDDPNRYAEARSEARVYLLENCLGVSNVWVEAEKSTTTKPGQTSDGLEWTDE